MDKARVGNVVSKLARGHAAFELSAPCPEEPTALRWWPICLMTEEERDSFDASHVTQLLGEVGSRGTQRLFVTHVTLESKIGQLATMGLVINDWVDVQDGRYRYHAIDDGGDVRIKIVIGEDLACEVLWAR